LPFFWRVTVFDLGNVPNLCRRQETAQPENWLTAPLVALDRVSREIRSLGYDSRVLNVEDGAAS